MMKKQSRYISGPIISVGKYRWAFYKNKRMTFTLLKKMGISNEEIEITKRQMKICTSPPGVYGGPVKNEDSVTEFLGRLGLKKEHITFKTRYHVTDHDAITPDRTPKVGVQYDYTIPSKGFKNRMLANLEAENRYSWYCKIYNEGGKPTQPVQLILLDKDGNIAKKKHNNYKPKRK